MPNFEIRGPHPGLPAEQFPLVLDTVEAESAEEAVRLVLSHIQEASAAMNVTPARPEQFRLLATDVATGEKTVARVVYHVVHRTAFTIDEDFEFDAEEKSPREKANEGLPKVAQEALRRDNEKKAAAAQAAKGSKAPPSIAELLGDPEEVHRLPNELSADPDEEDHHRASDDGMAHSHDAE